MSIKLLYATGDSWTYGEELGDVTAVDNLNHKFYNSWPWHVSQHYNIPQLINDARGGGSNARAYRRAIEFIQSYKGKLSELAIVIAWSTYERTEFSLPAIEKYHDGEKFVEWTERQFFHWHHSTDPAVMDFSGFLNPEQNATLSLLHKSWALLRDPSGDALALKNLMWSLQEICKTNKIKLHQFFALVNPEFEEGFKEFKPKWAKQIKYYQPAFASKKFGAGGSVTGFISKRFVGSHPNEQGHKEISNFVIDKIGDKI